MSRILAIANQKGGVGKTTTAVNLAASLADLGQRVLLADLDPQGNATMGAGIEKRTALPTVYQILLNQVTVRDARMRSEPGHFDVIPANRELAGAEIDLVNLEQRDLRLKVALAQVADDYDFTVLAPRVEGSVPRARVGRLDAGHLLLGDLHLDLVAYAALGVGPEQRHDKPAARGGRHRVAPRCGRRRRCCRGQGNRPRTRSCRNGPCGSPTR